MTPTTARQIRHAVTRVLCVDKRPSMRTLAQGPYTCAHVELAEIAEAMSYTEGEVAELTVTGDEFGKLAVPHIVARYHPAHGGAYYVYRPSAAVLLAVLQFGFEAWAESNRAGEWD